MPRWMIPIVMLLALCPAAGGVGAAAGVTLLTREPDRLEVRLPEATPGALYRVSYREGKHVFVWENLVPDASGAVVLTDDRHLQPEYRLRCESRSGPTDPVMFDDFTKGALAGRKRLPFGVPVSTFGGPGYLVPGTSSLVRDDRGNFWLYLDHPPYAILKYDRTFRYQFAVLLPDKLLAMDVDGEGNLWVLHPSNWISKHGPRGEVTNIWELPFGRSPGEVVLASGLAIDREHGWIYLADEILGRVQRFDLSLQLEPIVSVGWGWLGREDLAYTRAGEYDPDRMNYLLDRPRELRLDGQGHLLVSCEQYISKFDLATAKQVPFGPSPVLGWGGSFSDSPFSAAAALDGHWERHYLAGADASGRVYVADRNNEFVPDQRLQVFSAEGTPEQVYSVAREVKDAQGRRVYLGAVAQLAAADGDVWLTDAAGRLYTSHGGLREGGDLHLGPGAAGRQFDLSKAQAAKFTVEAQAARVRHTFEGRVLGFAGAEESTLNCEREGDETIKPGAKSLWLPSRLGEPFTVAVLGLEGKPLPSAAYAVEYEDRPSAFGTQYDFFRLTNISGAPWAGLRYRVEAKE